MASLYEILSDAQQGEAIAELGREFGLTPEQTQAAVESLLPAISARTDSKSFFAVLTIRRVQPMAHGFKASKSRSLNDPFSSKS